MHCEYLGCYVFSNFPRIQNHIAQLAITYEYDKNGVVHISALEKSTGQTLQLNVEALPPDVPDRFALPPVQQKEHQPLTIYLAFDLSGSMSGHPLQEAKRAARAFVRQCDLATTSVGLISFSNRVSVDLKATHKEREIEQTIEDMAIGRTGIGNTAHPFGEIFTLLRQQAGQRYTVVLADGVWSCQQDAIRTAKKCHTEQIEVIAIGFGHADKTFLSQIASTPEQSLFTDLSQLTETFSTIAQEITGAVEEKYSLGMHLPFSSSKKKRL